MISSTIKMQLSIMDKSYLSSCNAKALTTATLLRYYRLAVLCIHGYGILTDIWIFERKPCAQFVFYPVHFTAYYLNQSFAVNKHLDSILLDQFIYEPYTARGISFCRSFLWPRMKAT